MNIFILGLTIHPALEKVMRCCWDHRPFRRTPMAQVVEYLAQAFSSASGTAATTTTPNSP